MLLQRRVEARVGADRVPSGVDLQQRRSPVNRLAIVRPQRHKLAKGVDGRRLLVQGQMDLGQAPHVQLAEENLRHSLVRGCSGTFQHRGPLITTTRYGRAQAKVSAALAGGYSLGSSHTPAPKHGSN